MPAQSNAIAYAMQSALRRFVSALELRRTHLDCLARRAFSTSNPEGRTPRSTQRIRHTQSSKTGSACAAAAAAPAARDTRVNPASFLNYWRHRGNMDHRRPSGPSLQTIVAPLRLLPKAQRTGDPPPPATAAASMRPDCAPPEAPILQGDATAAGRRSAGEKAR